MATDWYPSQEGRIVDGVTLNCIAETAVAEGDCVKFGTSTSGQITVVPATAHGDAFGIAIRAAGVGIPVPVLVYGLYKCTVSTVAAAVEQGHACMNYTNAYISDVDDLAVVEAVSIAFSGACIILGMIMQTSTASGDEVLVLVGKCI